MFIRECLLLGNGLKYNVTKSLKSMPHFGSLPSPLGVKVKIRLRGVKKFLKAFAKAGPQPVNVPGNKVHEDSSVVSGSPVMSSVRSRLSGVMVIVRSPQMMVISPVSTKEKQVRAKQAQARE